MGKIMNSQKAVKSVTVGEQTVRHNIVIQKCQICEQGLYDDHRNKVHYYSM